MGWVWVGCSVDTIKEKKVLLSWLLEDRSTSTDSLRILISSFIDSGIFDLVIVADFEHASTNWNLPTHYNALGDTLDIVLLALDR